MSSPAARPEHMPSEHDDATPALPARFAWLHAKKSGATRDMPQPSTRRRIEFSWRALPSLTVGALGGASHYENCD